jgi:hypothetical protein|tara:strand:+ start:63 stop:269 length:207 start_codon:yes stop_codon:yes gene_type:complete
MSELSIEAHSLIIAIVKDISSLTHAYRDQFEACYELYISRYGYEKPIESKEVVVDKSIETLNRIVNQA